MLKIKLAALLHDIDDSKYFPSNYEYQNANYILKSVRQIDNLTDTDINDIIYMISLVSSSKNGDSIPHDCISKEWMLIPRYADRLEALGIIGVKRTLDYALYKKQPFFLPDTLRALDEYDLFQRIATADRYENYKGKSLSMIDHYYDKLLRLNSFPDPIIHNLYFKSQCDKLQQPLIDIVLLFGKYGTISEHQIRNFIDKNI
jgi:uncharacterized protein